MAVTDNFTVDEFIEHVKVSGSLTEEGREYIDVRDVRLIIEKIRNYERKDYFNSVSHHGRGNVHDRSH